MGFHVPSECENPRDEQSHGNVKPGNILGDEPVGSLHLHQTCNGYRMETQNVTTHNARLHKALETLHTIQVFNRSSRDFFFTWLFKYLP
jgi:hypothetical protein